MKAKKMNFKGFKSSVLAALAAVGMAAGAQAQTSYTWDGGSIGSGDSVSWNSFNWSGSAVPPDASGSNNNSNLTNLIFSGNLGLSNTNNFSNIDCNSIVFSSGAGSFILSGAVVGVDVGGITNSSGTTQTLSFSDFITGQVGGVVLRGPSQTWTAASGNLVISSNVTSYVENGYGAFGTSSPMALTIDGPSNTTISGFINEDTQDIANGTSVLSLVKNGTGTLTLSGSNSYSGGTTLNVGQLNLNHPFAIGTGTLTISGGALDNTSGGAITLTNNNAQIWAGDFAFVGTHDLNMGTGAVTLTGNRILNVAASNLTVGGVIGGSGHDLTKTGAGTLNLTGINTYTGLTTVSAGELDLNSAGQAIAGDLTVSGGTAKFKQNDQMDVTKHLVVNGGTLDVDAQKQTLAGVQLTGGSIVGTTGTLTSTSAFDLRAGTVSAILSGTVGLNKTTSGTVILNGLNNYTGATTVDGGTLAVGSTGAINQPASHLYVGESGTGTLTIASGGSVSNDYAFIGDTASSLGSVSVSGTWANSDTIFLGDSGRGSLTIQGGLVSSHDVSLGGQPTGSGSITISSGTLAATGLLFVGNQGTGTLTMSGGLVSAWAVELSNNLGSTGTANITGGTLDDSHDLDVANNATGVLNLSGSGRVLVGGRVNMATVSSAVGTLNIGTMTTGTLNVAEVRGGMGTATVNFLGTTGAYGFAPNLTGNLTVNQNGAGTTALTGSNTYTGPTNLMAGELDLNSATAISTGTLTISAGTTLDNTSGGAITLTNNNAQIWAGDFTFVGSHDLNLGTGAVTLTGDRILNVTASNLTVGGVIGDGGNLHDLTKTGAGTLTLSGLNTYTGLTFLTSGQLNLNSATAIGTGDFAIDAGTTLDNTSAGAVTLTTNNLQQWGGSFTFVGTHDLNLGAGAVTLSENQLVTVNASTLTVGGVIRDEGHVYGLTKAGAGTLNLTGINTYTGLTTVNAGELDLNSAGHAIGGDLTVSGGTAKLMQNDQINLDKVLTVTSGTFDVTTYNQTVGAVHLTGGSIAGSGGVLTGTSDFDLQAGSVSAILSGTVGLIASTSGTVTLSGANLYTGPTSLTDGQLNLNNARAIGTGTLTIHNYAAIDNTSGALVTLANNNVQIWNGGFTFRGTNELNLGTGTVTLATNSVVAVSGSDLTVGGAIVGSDGLWLKKMGLGTLKLAGNSTYTGPTYVNQGTLIVSGSLASSSVTVGDSLTSGIAILGGGGTVGDVHILNNFGGAGAILSPDAGGGVGATLTTGNLDFGGPASTLAITIASPSSYSQIHVTGLDLSHGGTLTLNITGSVSVNDQFFFIRNSGVTTGRFTTINGITPTDIGNNDYTFTISGQDYMITYDANFSNSGALTGGNDVAIVAVPEPRTWAMLAGGFCMLMFIQRIRRKSGDC